MVYRMTRHDLKTHGATQDQKVVALYVFVGWVKCKKKILLYVLNCCLPFIIIDILFIALEEGERAIKLEYKSKKFHKVKIK